MHVRACAYAAKHNKSCCPPPTPNIIFSVRNSHLCVHAGQSGQLLMYVLDKLLPMLLLSYSVLFFGISPPPVWWNEESKIKKTNQTKKGKTQPNKKKGKTKKNKPFLWKFQPQCPVTSLSSGLHLLVIWLRPPYVSCGHLLAQHHGVLWDPGLVPVPYWYPPLPSSGMFCLHSPTPVYEHLTHIFDSTIKDN